MDPTDAGQCLRRAGAMAALLERCAGPLIAGQRLLEVAIAALGDRPEGEQRLSDRNGVAHRLGVTHRAPRMLARGREVLEVLVDQRDIAERRRGLPAVVRLVGELQGASQARQGFRVIAASGVHRADVAPRFEDPDPVVDLLRQAARPLVVVERVAPGLHARVDVAKQVQHDGHTGAIVEIRTDLEYLRACPQARFVVAGALLNGADAKPDAGEGGLLP